MRVIAGKYRFKPIKRELKGLKTNFRPTKSIVRESVFNIINHYCLNQQVEIEGAVVLDTFCGSGAYGIEALSRGAKCAYFVNKCPSELKLAEHNVSALNDSNINAEFICADATRLNHISENIDIIFIDPPYHTGLWRKSLEAIRDNLDLSDQHLIILELAKHEKYQEVEGFKVINFKQYGNTAIYILQKNIAKS